MLGDTLALVEGRGVLRVSKRKQSRTPPTLLSALVHFTVYSQLTLNADFSHLEGLRNPKMLEICIPRAYVSYTKR